MKISAEHYCHGGTVIYAEHEAKSTNCTMRFSVFLPPQAKTQKCPALIYLAGLTCTEDTFTTKAQAYQFAAQRGIILIAPDTSPRGDNVADDDGYDLGQGAGFYINATESPWKEHFQMETYIVDELPKLLREIFPIDTDRLGIFGHSMGGHGALTLYLKHPDIFKTVSAFAPICSPTKCPWGQKAFSAYLGDDEKKWQAHDATELMKSSAINWKGKSRYHILIDQGLADNFLAEQLYPELFEKACKQANQPITLRRHDGYDHGYFFIQSFMNEHITHHANILGKI